MSLEIFFVGVKHAVEPWEKLVRAVIAVEDHGNAVRLCDGSDVMGSGNSTNNGGLLFVVGETLSRKVSRSSL